MNLQSLAISKAFKEKYSLHGKAVLEYNFDNAGEHDLDKRGKSNNFVARLRTISNNFDAMYQHQHQVMSSFVEIPCVAKLACNENAFNYLAPIYARIAIACKNFRKAYKENENVPEVKEYFKEAYDMLEINVYQMMKDDFAILQPIVAERMENDKKKFKDFSCAYSSDINWEVVNEQFKKTK